MNGTFNFRGGEESFPIFINKFHLTSSLFLLADYEVIIIWSVGSIRVTFIITELLASEGESAGRR